MICKIFRGKKLHHQTIRGWIKSGELEAISTRPILIYGAVLKVFIQNRNQAHKNCLEFNQIKCVKCKVSSVPQNNEINIKKNKNGSLKVEAFCPVCHSTPLRFYKQTEYEQLKETFTIKKPEASTLSNQSSNASKTDLGDSYKTPLNESCQNIGQEVPNSVTKPKQQTLFEVL